MVGVTRPARAGASGLVLYGVQPADERCGDRFGLGLAARRPALLGPTNRLAVLREGTGMASAESLTEYLVGRRCKAFVPRPHYFQDGDFVSYYFAEERAYEER